MKQITVEAPCKINLSLDIVRRLDNGYHEMDMVMQSVSLYDTLVLTLCEGDGSICMSCTMENSSASLACDDSNIAVRCAKAFLYKAGIDLSSQKQNLTLKLIKRIPMMAGLGGGSADGAAVLYGLNRLLQTHFSLEQLEQIGVLCGADIPFCLQGGTLRAQGIGEILSPLPPMPDCPIVIIKPRFGISTAKAFARCDSSPYPHANTDKMISALQSAQPCNVAKALENVFESICSPDEQQLLLQARRLLEQNGSMGTLLSGSGSALFGIFRNETSAQHCAEALRSHPLLEGVFLCHPICHGVREQICCSR